MRLTYNWEKEFNEINAKRYGCSSAEEYVEKFHQKPWKCPYQPMHNITRKDVWNKLGKLEDILERHNIETLDELDSLLFYVKQIKKFEVDFGINAMILLTAMKDGVWVKHPYNSINYEPFRIDYWDDYKTGEKGMLICGMEIKDYGITWALTKEALQ